MDSRKIGIWGEVMVARYLREHGYDILTSNYRCRLGEIDIIAENKKYLCFVEVKTRGENALYSPAEAVGLAKQKRIIATAKHFLLQVPLKKQPRLDVAEVFTKNGEIEKINYIANAYSVDGI